MCVSFLFPRIAAACLLLHWCKEADEHLFYWMCKSASDITLAFKSVGSGTTFQIKKFGFIEDEERAKQHLGMSALGKCQVLVSLANSIQADKGTSDPAVIIAAFKENEVKIDSWSADTMSRYLAVGRKLAACAEVCDILRLAEFSFGRAAHFDGITNLRALTGHRPCNCFAAFLMFCKTTCSVCPRRRLCQRHGLRGQDLVLRAIGWDPEELGTDQDQHHRTG